MDMSSGIQGGVSDMVRDPGDPSFLRDRNPWIHLTGAVQDTENTCLFDLLYIEEQNHFFRPRNHLPGNRCARVWDWARCSA